MTVEGTTLVVHRCRFVDYTPSAVTALAFPPLPLPSAKAIGKKSAVVRKALKFGTLAIGRANGNIELCEWTGNEQHLQAPQAWVVNKTITGPYSSKVDSLAFTLRSPDGPSDETPSIADLRLFSAGGGNELAEWDVERACVRRTIPSQGGSIWCITANPASTILALGCEDGAIRLISLEHDTLTHFRRLDRAKSRILSVAWGPPIPRQERTSSKADDEDSDDSDNEEDEWKDSWLVAGCSDSSLRKWDIASGRMTERMGTDKMRGERTLVWAVGTFGDGTIVSGDSLGMVKFWDSRTCTQLQSFQAHDADVLCLTISPDGTAVYSSGVDQKVIQYSLVKTQQSTATQSSILSRSSSRWVQSTSRRLHSHDVRGLAVWPPHSPLPSSHRRTFPLDVAPILASGGLDMNVTVTPAALPSSTITKVVNPLSTSQVSTFEDSYHRRLAYSSGAFNSSALHLARQARLLLCQRDAGVSIWRIKNKEPQAESEDVESAPPSLGGWESVLDMELSVHTNLVTSAISDDGKWVVVSDWYESKLFSIQRLENGDLKPRRVKSLTSVLQSALPSNTESTGASAFAFTPDGTKLCMACAMTAYIIIIDLSGQQPVVLRKFEQHRQRDVLLGRRIIRGRSKSAGLPVQTGQDVDMHGAAGDSVDQGDAMDVDGTTAPENIEADASSSGSESDDEPIPPSTPFVSTVTRIAISADGQWLATTDIHRRTHIFNLDSVSHHCILPSFPSAIHALAFDSSHATSSSSSILVLGLADNTIHVYDVESRTFPVWGRDLAAQIPMRFRHLHDPILGVTFDTGSKTGALFWGATWLCRVHLSHGLSDSGAFDKRKRRWGGRALTTRPRPASLQATGMNAIDLAPQTSLDQEREQERREKEQENFKVVTTYRPILFVNFIGERELVIVERPLVDVLSKLPPAFFKPKYGAT